MTNPITCNTFCASSNDVNLGSSSISFSEIKTEITGGKDSKSKGKSVKRTKNDVSGGIDNKLRGKSINRSKTDLLGEVDNKLKLKSLNRMRTDVFAGVDSKLREKSILRQMNDILGGVDSKTKIASLKRILSELITAVDTESRIKDVYRAFYDCLDNLDGTERFKEIYRELTDFFDAVDNQSKVKDIFRGFIDYIEGYDTKSQEFGFNRLFSEVIELLDIETRVKSIFRTIIDELSELDSKIRIKTISRNFTDLISGLDTSIGQWGRIFTELFGPSDVAPIQPFENIINGGFETGDFTGWNHGGFAGAPFITSPGHTGNYKVYLYEGWMNQNLYAKLCNITTLGFWMNGSTTSDYHYKLTFSDGSYIQNQIGSFTWKHYDLLPIIAEKTQSLFLTNIEFLCTSRYINDWIDDVTCITVSVPPFLSRVKHIFRKLIDKIGEKDTKGRIKSIYRTKIEKIGSKDINKIRIKVINRIKTELLGISDRLRPIINGIFITEFTELLGGLDIKGRMKAIHEAFTEVISTPDIFIDPLIPGIHAVWHLNETSGTIAFDSTFQDRWITAKDVNGPWLDSNWVPGKLHNAVQLDNTRTLFSPQSRDVAQFSKDHPFTYEMWFKLTEYPPDGSYFHFVDIHDFNVRWYHKESTMNKPLIWVTIGHIPSGDFTWLYGEKSFDLNTWYFMTIVWDGNWQQPKHGFRMYINAVGLSLGSPWSGDKVLLDDCFYGDLYIGAWMTGLLDEVLVYGVSPTKEMIEEDYNNGIGGRELHYFMPVTNIVGLKDLITRIIKYSLHHGHQHWWRDKPKQKVVVGD